MPQGDHHYWPLRFRRVRAKANAIDLYASGEVSTSRRLAIWEAFPLTTKS